MRGSGYAEIAQKVYNAPFQLIDIASFSDSDISSHQQLELMELLFKKISTSQIITSTEPGQRSAVTAERLY